MLSATVINMSVLSTVVNVGAVTSSAPPEQAVLLLPTFPIRNAVSNVPVTPANSAEPEAS